MLSRHRSTSDSALKSQAFYSDRMPLRVVLVHPLLSAQIAPLLVNSLPIIRGGLTIWYQTNPYCAFSCTFLRVHICRRVNRYIDKFDIHELKVIFLEDLANHSKKSDSNWSQ